MVYRAALNDIPLNGIPLNGISLNGIPYIIEWYFQWFSMVKYTAKNTVGLITSKYHSMAFFNFKYHSMVLNGIFNGI